MKRTVELFSGSKSFSKVRKDHGDKIFTVDNVKEFNPDLVIDILKLERLQLPEKIDIVWASPPCTTFSVASIGTHWSGGKGAYIPKTEECKVGLEILEKTIKLISEIKPKYWYIENPQGVMKNVIEKYFKKYGLDYVERTIWYCKYGAKNAKPTNIWTNNYNWTPRLCCKNYKYRYPKEHPKAHEIIDRSCHHESARRGSRTGTQGLKNDFLRSQIPADLFIEMKEYESEEYDRE